MLPDFRVSRHTELAMSERSKAFTKGIVAGAVGLLVVGAVGGLAVVYTGAYNVAATEEHLSVTRWAFNTTFSNSIERRSDDVVAPERFSEAMVAAGAGEYAGTCVHCHAAPGVERGEWVDGMRPRPPHLTEVAGHWAPEELFWLVKHGAKMTGMPAFGPSHDDETLWNIVAFVSELPAMTPERYATLRDQAGNRPPRG
jgi:mono/diheme cytochrome c family protein